MNCNNCNKNKKIVNKHFNLCLECNNERLHGSKYGKKYDNIKKQKKIIRSNKKYVKKQSRQSLFNKKTLDKPKLNKNLLKDEELYEKSFNLSNHKCEECGTPLPTEFRNEKGFIIARFRYSHIIPKSIAPELRHNVNNINNLCLDDHRKWENGDKKSMKIFKNNYKKFPNYLNRYL